MKAILTETQPRKKIWHHRSSIWVQLVILTTSEWCRNLSQIFCFLQWLHRFSVSAHQAQ